MKPRALPLGTVCALIGLAATSTQAAPVRSSLSNITLPLGEEIFIDINADGTDDFMFYDHNGTYVMTADVVGNQIVSDGENVIHQYSEDQLISPTANMEPIVELQSLYGTGAAFYAGVSFLISEANHMGWLQFSFPSDTPDDGLLIAAGWESTAETAIDAGSPAIPEPSTSALGLAALPLAIAVWWRRRRARHAN